MLWPWPSVCTSGSKEGGGGGGGWHKAPVSDCLPLAASIGLSPLLILILCGPERVLVVGLNVFWLHQGEPLHCARIARYFYTRFPPKRPQAHPFQRPLNSGHPNYRS